MAYIEVKNLEKQYPEAEFLSVENFNLEIEEGEFIVFVGPSGCGKSTTLRMIAGLEDITGGELYIDGLLVNSLHPKDRDISMVFQNYALYPHLTVFENIGFGLQVRKLPKHEIEEKVQWAASILGLEPFLDRRPKDLSGGQRQRVALGRAIVREPKLFLMDEPLSNLDAKLRVSTRNEIIKLHRQLKATSIYVTHDQVEAMTMADRIVVMSDGLIQQVGTPMEVYKNPVNTYVATFIGAPEMNIINTKIVDGKLQLFGKYFINIPGGIAKKIENYNKEGIIFGCRPETVSVERVVMENRQDEIISMKIAAIEKMGVDNHIYLVEDKEDSDITSTIVNEDEIENSFVVRIPENRIKEEDLQIGNTLEFTIDMNKIHLFDIDTTTTLL